MQILITGAAGFIGFNLSKYLLDKSNVKIIGVDSLNTYYSKKLKKDRIEELSKYKNFAFFNLNILNKKKLEKIFKIKKINLVINLAAQAGVRYSLVKPSEFIENNVQGFYNIIEVAKKYKIKKIIYASSSSVYGDSRKFPLKETQNISPKNIYALSKKINEEMADIFSKQYNISFIGLRFFTVYGEWGRPDMMMLKFIDSYYKKKSFKLHNYGNHTRDFTYIKDVVEILFKLLQNNKKLKNNDVLNICSNNPINLSNVISFMRKNNIKPKITKISLQKADILKTHGDNRRLFKYIGKKKFNNWKSSIKNLIFWYQKNML